MAEQPGEDKTEGTPLPPKAPQIVYQIQQVVFKDDSSKFVIGQAAAEGGPKVFGISTPPNEVIVLFDDGTFVSRVGTKEFTLSGTYAKL